MNLVYDRLMGWYDADEAFCINGCGKHVVEWQITEMLGTNVMTEGLCQSCLDRVSNA